MLDQHLFGRQLPDDGPPPDLIVARSIEHVDPEWL